MKTKRIEVSNGEFVNFPVIDFNGKVGDDVWCDFGTKENPFYCHGVIKELQPDYWWVYEDRDESGRTIEVPCLGHATVRFDDDGYDTNVPYVDLLLENPEPKEMIHEDITLQEALQTVISELDTPIARRRHDEYFNKCVTIVKNKICS